MSEATLRKAASGDVVPRPHSRGWVLGFVTAAVLVAVTVLLTLRLASCLGWGGVRDRYRNSPSISLASPKAKAASPARLSVGNGKLPLRLTVAPVVSPETSLKLYSLLSDHLAVTLGQKVSLLTRSSYAEVNALLRTRQTDVAFVCTYAFVQGERDFGLKAVAIPVIKGKRTYQSYIIAPASSPASSLLDFKGRRFASSDVLSNSGWLYPKHWLTEQGIKPGAFFGRHLITGSHDRTVHAVVRGQVDGAAVDSLVYDHMLKTEPALRAKLKVIARSTVFGMPPVVVHPSLAPALQARIVKALLDVHKTPAGRKALKVLGFDRFAKPEQASYDLVRKMAARMEPGR